MKDIWDNSDLIKKEARFSFKEIMIIIISFGLWTLAMLYLTSVHDVKEPTSIEAKEQIDLHGFKNWLALRH
jgi:hypothetical protein